MRNQLASAVLFITLVACGGPGSVDGKIKGQAYPIGDSASASVTVLANLHAAAVVMTNTNDVCGDAIANTVHPSTKYVVLTAFDVNGTTATTPVAPGTYAIFQGGTPPAKAATFSAGMTDATCQNIATAAVEATTGTITIEAVSGNMFKGKFDVALDSGDHVTGSFDPEPCPELQSQFGDTPPACI